MPPHAETRERDRQAFHTRARGATWDRVAEKHGYSSAAAACKAVRKFAQKTPPERLDTLRALSFANRQAAMELAWAITRKAAAEGRNGDALAGLRTINDLQDRLDRMSGVATHVPVEVTVSVGAGSAVAIIEQAEKQLLALAASSRPVIQPAGEAIIDAEIIEQEKNTP